MAVLDKLSKPEEWKDLSRKVTQFFGDKKQEFGRYGEIVHHWCGYNLTKEAFEVKIFKRPVEGELNEYTKSDECLNELGEILSNSADRYLITYQVPGEKDQNNVQTLKRNF